jgi:transposase
MTSILQILGEAVSPGAVVTHVARGYDISTALIYTWRRKVCEAQIELYRSGGTALRAG